MVDIVCPWMWGGGMEVGEEKAQMIEGFKSKKV